MLLCFTQVREKLCLLNNEIFSDFICITAVYLNIVVNTLQWTIFEFYNNTISTKEVKILKFSSQLIQR